MIKQNQGNERGALDAFKKALAMNPFMPSVKKAVDELQKKREQGI